MRSRFTRSQDPYWLTLRFPAVCSGRDCGCELKAGEEAFYYPNGRRFFGKACGHGDAAATDFESHRSDEENNRSL